MGTALTTNEQNTEFSAMAKQTGATTTADRDIFASGAGSVKVIHVQNTDGSTIHFLKIYDDKDPVNGTDLPIFVMQVGTSTSSTVFCNPGIVCSTGVSVIGSTAGGTAAGSTPDTTELPYTIYGGA